MQAIQNVIGEIKDLDETMQHVVQQVVAVKEIQDFITNNQLTLEQVQQDVIVLLEYADYLKKQEQGILSEISPNVEGYIFLNDYQHIEFGYRYTARFQEIVKLKEYIECLYMDEYMLRSNIADFQTFSDSSAIQSSVLMVPKIRKQEPIAKGLYLGGKNGVGKTHLLMALAKEFAHVQTKVLVVFVPELIRILKQDIYQSNALIRKMQRVPVLMLDDIGSEMQTSFSRDEVLLPILNARMSNKQLTFFTSNLDLSGLEHHFAHTQYGEHEPVKAKRMIERVKALSEYVVLSGENMRK